MNDLDAALEEPLKVVRALDKMFWRPQHTVNIAMSRPEFIAALRRDMDNSSWKPSLYYAFDKAMRKAGYSVSCARFSQEWYGRVRIRKRRQPK